MFINIINEIKMLVGNDFLAAMIILLIFVLLSKAALYFVEKILMSFAKKTETELDDMILEIIHKPISFIIILLGLLVALDVIGLDKGNNIVLFKIIYSLFILLAGYLVSKILNVFIEHWGQKLAKRTESSIDDQLVGLFQTVSIVIAWSLAIIFVLQTWDVQVAPLLASLGIAGVAVAFALQSSLGNIFGGVSLIIDKSIRVGDVVELEDKTSGTVLNVGLRSTKIRTWNNEVLIIPNGKLADARIVNYVQPEEKVRVIVPFGVAYGSDIAKVKDLVKKEMKKIDHLIDDPEPYVIFIEMASSSLNFNAYFFVDSYSKRFRAKDQANTLIYNALNKNKISIPFPQLDVHMKNAKEEPKKKATSTRREIKSVNKKTAVKKAEKKDSVSSKKMQKKPRSSKVKS